MIWYNRGMKGNEPMSNELMEKLMSIYWKSVVGIRDEIKAKLVSGNCSATMKNYYDGFLRGIEHSIELSKACFSELLPSGHLT